MADVLADHLPAEVDVLVIDAGQAGLGAAYWLTREPGLRVLVVDRAPVGQTWRGRWDSLVLFTPRRFSSLAWPGLPFPAGGTRCPTRLEMAAYLEHYAQHFDLPVRTGVDVRRLSREDSGAFFVEASHGVVRTYDVVVATGPFHRRHVPAATDDLSNTEQQARDAGLDVKTVTYEIGSVAGGVLLGNGVKGRAQLAIDQQERVVVGATFVGPNVGEMLHAATIAVVGKVPIDTLWHAVPAFPTVSEVWLRLLEADRGL